MKLVIRSGLLALTLAAGGLVAQNPAIQRTILQWQDTSVPGREVVIARVKIRPGGAAGPHTHPGEEISYILDGEAEILVDGKPPLRVKSGDSFVIPAGARHDNAPELLSSARMETVAAELSRRMKQCVVVID